MSWRDLMLGRRADSRALDHGSGAPLLLTSGDGERLSTSRALGLADVFACVRVLAESAASLPLRVYRQSDAGREQLRSGRLAELVEHPAPAVTTASFVGGLTAHLVLYGNAYVGKYRDAEGRIVQLGLLDPAIVQVKVESGQPVYELHRAEGVTRHGPADVLHVRAAVSSDGILGLSPIAATRNALSLNDALAAHARSFASNAGRPSGVLKVPNTTPDQLKALKRSFGRRHGGPEKSGNIAVVEGDLTWEALSISLADAEFVDQRRLSTAEIARIFRVPPWMIGAPAGDSMTYSNTSEQAAAFVRFSLRPWLVTIEQALSSDRDLAPGALYVEFALDALLRADAKSRAEVYRAALDPITGWMTREEVRELENLPPETSVPDPERSIA